MAEGKKSRMKDQIPEDARQHYKQAHKELRESILSLFPPEFVEHRRAARREMLLAARSLINHAIERIEKHEG
jgi:predicted nuclease with RNAse H fold